MKKNTLFNIAIMGIFLLCLLAIANNLWTDHKNRRAAAGGDEGNVTVTGAAAGTEIQGDATQPSASSGISASNKKRPETDSITSATITKDGRLLAPLYKQVTPPQKEAMFYEELPGGAVKCRLCPWECTLKPNEVGLCNVRQNIDGKLISLCHSRPCSIAIDPIEKKPFYHFMPGEQAFSLATAGCNLFCKFCQNWSISQAKPEDVESFYIPPAGIVKLAKRTNTKVISFTYSEPVVFYEYMIETARHARKEGIKSTVVSGGFINPEPLKELCKYVDGIKIDLKAFNEKYYKEIVGGRLQPVLETLKIIKQEGVHLEIVYLVVPTLNDDTEEIKRMCLWIKENLGDKIPLHFSRFSPRYKMQNYPETPLSTVENLRKIAMECGLKYVYVGNVPPGNEGESTYCHNCGKVLVKRTGYYVAENNIISAGGRAGAGKCKFCGTPVYGEW
ncbi:MAG: AmmeMemoRadiSam system radical SAM enzyme [Elusimicrobiota bacterium]